MSQDALLFAGLVALALAGCQNDPRCPVGTTQVRRVCFTEDPAGDRLDDAGADADGGPRDASADPGSEGDDGGAPTPCKPAPEQCNQADDDCDGAVDEEVTLRAYLDADGDGHGSAADPGDVVCAGALPAGRVPSHDDCDDAEARVFPGGAEVCDRLDNDCDALVDEQGGEVGGLRVRYRLDCDGDSYLAVDAPTALQCPGEVFPPATSCITSGDGVEFAPVWREAADLAEGVDCADADAQAFPGSTTSSAHPVAGTEGYDYDCSGEATPVLRPCAALFACSAFPHSCYVDDAECGEPATRRVCSCTAEAECTPSTGMVDVACR